MEAEGEERMKKEGEKKRAWKGVKAEGEERGRKDNVRKEKKV